MRTVNKKVWHHSDSDIKAHDNVETLRKWHIEERGFSDIGYHFFIDRAGMVHKCRPIEKIGAHCLNGHNKDSVGICLHGKEWFSDDQIYSAKLLNEELDSYFGKKLPNFRHGELDSDKFFCPNYKLP